MTTGTHLDRIQREERNKVLAVLAQRGDRSELAVHYTLGWIEGTAGAFAVGRPAERLARIRGAIEAFTEFSARPSAAAIDVPGALPAAPAPDGGKGGGALLTGASATPNPDQFHAEVGP